MPGTRTVIDRTKRFFNIKDLEKFIPIKKDIKKRGVTYANRLKFQNPDASKSVGLDIENEDKNIKKQQLDTHKHSITDLPPAFILDGIVDIFQDKDQAIRKAEDRKIQKSLLKTSDITDDTISIDQDVYLNEELKALAGGFADKMPGFTPNATGGILEAARRKVQSALSKTYSPAVKTETDLAQLDEYLICNISKYKDPEDNQKYFKISIRSGKDAKSLATAPKEIVFLVDCSLSIQQKRLKEFKKGLSYCLNDLNPNDRFNVMAFKESMKWLSPKSLSPTKENIYNALRFVDKLSAGEGTDAYNALYKSINIRSSLTPSYIVLFSDGRPTYGMTDPIKIIHKISDKNKGKRPIFAFSGGARVNRYFLDFISYKNRGWTEYARSTYAIGKHISRMYEKIKDPLLLNLRYNISELDKSQIFPKELPDFYKNTEFTLYGKYVDEDEFSLQFLGDLEGETNEFMIVGSLDKATESKADIAKNWAFNKIYYLIGKLKSGHNNTKILDEINYLCKKFKIQTPYSREIKR